MFLGLVFGVRWGLALSWVVTGVFLVPSGLGFPGGLI